VSMAHLVAMLLRPQLVSDFEHEIGASGSPHRRDSGFSERE